MSKIKGERDKIGAFFLQDGPSSSLLLFICNLQLNQPLRYDTAIGINRYLMARRPQDFLTFCHNEMLLCFQTTVQEWKNGTEKEYVTEIVL